VIMARNDHSPLAGDRRSLTRLGRRALVAQGALPVATTCGFAGGADDLEWQ
jgi:hypothetical protein